MALGGNCRDAKNQEFVSDRIHKRTLTNLFPVIEGSLRDVDVVVGLLAEVAAVAERFVVSDAAGA